MHSSPPPAVQNMSSASCDWSCHSPAFLLGWGLPIAALSLSGPFAPSWMHVIWPVAFLWMSVACVLNAGRCGRVHCYFTGVFFFILSVLSGLHGFDVVDLGSSAWSWISVTAIIGGVALTIFPEMIWGRYRGPGSSQRPVV
jgi:hypothetical protein